MLRRQTEFSVGQRIRKRSRGGGIWEIMGIHKDPSGAVHIEMFSMDDPNTRRTLSRFALSDPEQFELVSI
tara:strand:+ start:259 stop:468 length:210 start_codon:yes stop_codon:yes gene_type:complete